MPCVILLTVGVSRAGAEGAGYDLAPSPGSKAPLEVEKTELWSGRPFQGLHGV